MRSLALRSAILVVAAAILIAIPTVLILGNRTPKSASPLAAANLTEVAGDFNGRQVRRAERLPLGTPTAAAATPSATPASTASGLPPVPTPPAATPVPTPRPTASPTPAGVPAFSHVFVIVMENHEYGSIIGSSAAPYINGLASTDGLATNYYGASHPSLPNYLALTAGSTFGIASHCTTCFVGATNIADQVG